MSAPSVLNAALNAALATGVNAAQRRQQMATSSSAAASTSRTPTQGHNETTPMTLDGQPGAQRSRKGSKRHNSVRIYPAVPLPGESRDDDATDLQAKPYHADRRRNGERIEQRGRSKSEPSNRFSVLIDGTGKAVSLTNGKGRAGNKDDDKEPGAVSILQTFLRKRYDPHTKLLDLENIAGDALWQSSPVGPPFSSTAPRKAVPVMWKLCQAQFPDIQSISLAGNGIQSIKSIHPQEVVSFLPGLRNLSLGNNQISHIEELNPLSSYIFKQHSSGLDVLNELVLTGNPAQSRARESGQKQRDYRSAILHRFPTLTQLDGQIIAPLVPSQPSMPPVIPLRSRGGHLLFPYQSQAGFSDTQEVRETVARFLFGYLSAFDNDRPTLATVLASESTFSLSVDRTRSDRMQVKRQAAHGALGKSASLDAWNGRSRNIAATPHQQDKKRSDLHSGPEAILAALKVLPGTTHPLDNGDKFVVDSWTVPNLLPGDRHAICGFIHGEFTELPIKALRSFDRDFVLVVAPNPTVHAPYIVLSDQLVVRNYSPPDLWPVSSSLSLTLTPSNVIAPATSRSTPSVDGIAEIQSAMLAQLKTETKLVDDYAKQCLAESQWDYPLALQSEVHDQLWLDMSSYSRQDFNRVRNQIPPAAFIT